MKHGKRETRAVAALFEIQDGCCFHCGEPMLRGADQQHNKQRGWSREHVVPKSQAPGLHGNTVLAHVGCNAARADRLPTVDEVARAWAILVQLEERFRAPSPSLRSEFLRPSPTAGGAPCSGQSLPLAKAGGQAFATLGEVWPGETR
jgi:hypothetical protein